MSTPVNSMPLALDLIAFACEEVSRGGSITVNNGSELHKALYWLKDNSASLIALANACEKVQAQRPINRPIKH